MRVRTAGRAAVILLGWLAIHGSAHQAAAQVPSAPQSAVQKRVDARLLEQKQQECAKKGQFAVATVVRNAVLYKCVTGADPALKAQTSPRQ
jgi:hypothetical protein